MTKGELHFGYNNDSWIDYDNSEVVNFDDDALRHAGGENPQNSSDAKKYINFDLTTSVSDVLAKVGCDEVLKGKTSTIEPLIAYSPTSFTNSTGLYF